MCNNKTYTNPNKIANKFNEYFAGVGPSTIKHKGKDFNEYMGKSCSFTCFFKPTDEQEILTIIRKLGNNKSPGYDDITPGLV